MGAVEFSYRQVTLFSVILYENYNLSTDWIYFFAIDIWEALNKKLKKGFMLPFYNALVGHIQLFHLDLVDVQNSEAGRGLRTLSTH